jgi:hypothetical protein
VDPVRHQKMRQTRKRDDSTQVEAALDGMGSIAAVKFAVMKNLATPSAADFMVV